MASGLRSDRRLAGVGDVRESVAFGVLERERLGELQRARILSAMFDVVCERGAGNVSVAHVVERSGVSRRTFYEHFADREDCLLAAFQDALAHATRRVLTAAVAVGEWRARVRAGLFALLCFLDEQPAMGRLLIVESLACGPRVAERRLGVIAELTRIVDDGRSQNGSTTAGPLTAEGVVGGVLAVIQTRLTPPKSEPVTGLLNQLMGMILLPYLGAAAVRRELDRPLPHTNPSVRDGLLLSDPFKDAGMRLTYRTLRVLVAIDEHNTTHNTGPSNRQIGETAGITDQGQISKLLGRLERIELIHNTGLGPGLGAPNQWSLTPQGQQLTHTIQTTNTQQTASTGTRTGSPT